MKKLVALLLGTAMMASFACFTACTDESDTPGPDGPGPVGPGGVHPEEPTITRRADPRDPDAYEAYDVNGTKVGSYKTIGLAINATVEADADFMEDKETADGTKGGYVTKKGSTFHLFDNKKGFASGNSDQFWYYVNGTELTGYNCWDATTGITTLHNTKVVAHETTNMGLNSIQSWNGYGMLDETGNEINDGTLAQSWELSSPMDAGVMMFPARKSGVAGLKYKIDLSEVKITPAYEGVEDPVYAYIGFYAWQDYYVVATGIGCDTTTGQWYEFRGTSRDNSFSDIEYEMGDCIMESTWHEEDGGYFTPNSTEIDMQIKTVKKVDEFDETYWVDEMDITPKGGEAFHRDIDDEIINGLFGKSVQPDNGFVFIAGLDIRNKIESGVAVQNVDYFNGAKFENLKVLEAAVYFPAEEEISDAEFGTAIDVALRGQWHDALMANDAFTEGTIDYTLLNGYAFIDFQKKNEADYYSFKFDGSPVSDQLIGGVLKDYQDKIDSLKGMTSSNVKDYADTYLEVTNWYGIDANHTNSTGILQQYLLLLDFAPYEAAVEIYNASLDLSAEAKEVVTVLDKLGVLSAYPYVGWEAPDGTEDLTGYLWSQAQQFAAVLEKYEKLGEGDKTNLFQVAKMSEEDFEDWKEFYTSVKAYFDNADYMAKSFTVGTIAMGGKDVVYTAKEAIIKIFELAYGLKNNTYAGAPEAGVMCSDNTQNYQESFHLLFLRTKVAEETELPSFVSVVIDYITNTDRSAGFMTDFDDYIYPVLTLAGQIYQKQQAGEYVWLDEEIAEVVNTYMVGFEKFIEAGFNWNLPNNGDLRDGNTNYEHYFGLPDLQKDFAGSVKYIIDVVLACDPDAVVKQVYNKDLAFEAEVTPLAEDPTKQGSEAAQAIVARVEALSDLAEYAYKGWTAADDAIAGYLYSEVLEYRAIVEAREALSTADNAYISANIDADKYAAWTTLSDEIAAVVTTIGDKTLTTYTKAYDEEKATKSYTALEALAELVTMANTIKTEGKLSDSGSDTAKETLDVDTNFNSSARLATFYHFLKTNDATMPGYLKGVLTAIGLDNYYDTFYYPLYNVVQIGQRIANEKLDSTEDFTDAELAFLNAYWTSNYQLTGVLATHWWANGGYFGWINWKMPRFTLFVGGTLENKTLPSDYAEYINDLLTENNYVVNEAQHNWGVTAGEILETPLSKEALEIVLAFAELSNIEAYATKGWIAPEGTAIKGYLYSEAKHYTEQIAPKLSALGEEEAETVSILVGTLNYEGWAALAPQIMAISEEDAAKTFTTKAQYTVGEGLGVILAALGDLGGKCMDSDNYWDASLRVIVTKLRIEELGVELPEYIMEKIETATDDNATNLIADIEYLDAVFTLYAKIAALGENAKLELTEDVLALINRLVGVEKFHESGLNWNFTEENRSGGHPQYQDFIYRHGYKVYWGYEDDKDGQLLNFYLDTVMNYLKNNFGATPTAHNMGITEAIKPE